MIRLALERPLVSRGGDRFVLRSFSPVETIGGGWVVDSAPFSGRPQWPEGIADQAPAIRLAALVERRPLGLEVSAVPAVLGVAPKRVAEVVDASGLIRAGEFLVTAGAVAKVREAVAQALEEFHRQNPTHLGMPLETLRQSLSRRGAAAEPGIQQLIESAALSVDGSVVRARGFKPRLEGDNELMGKVVGLIQAGAATPPSVAELETALKVPGVMEALKLAGRSGQIEAVDRERYFSSSALTQFREVVARIGAAGPITPQALRDETGLSRKFLIPLLEWSDRTGLTIRSGDSRLLARRRTTPVGGA